MNIDDLKNRLLENIQENQLVLNRVTTNLSSVEITLNTINTDSIIITLNRQPHILEEQPPENSISALISSLPPAEVLQVTGTATLLNTNVNTSVLFIPVNETIEFFVIADLITDWKFSDSFPTITDGLSSSLAQQGEKLHLNSLLEKPPVFLNELQLSNSKVILSSIQFKNEQDKTVLEKGLNLEAACLIKENENGSLKLIKTLTAGVFWNLNGTIVFSEDEYHYPQINMLAELPLDTEIFHENNAGFQLKNIWLRLFSKVNRNGHSYITSEISLGCTVQAGKTALNLESELIDDYTDILRLHGSFEGLKIPGLSELSAFVGGDDLAGLLPEEFNELPALEIINCDIAIPLKKPAIDYFNIVTRLTKQGSSNGSYSWTLIEPWLQAEDIFLELAAYDLFKKEERQIVFTFHGEIIIAGAVIDLWAIGPQFRISGKLAEGNGIQLETFIREIANGMQMELGIPKSSTSNPLTIQDLEFGAQPCDKYYYFGIKVAGDYSINLFGDLKLALEKIEFNLALENGKPGALLSASFNFAEANFYTTAAIPAGEDALSFAGGLKKDSEISFNTLISEFYKELFPGSSLPIPQGLPELFFEDVKFALNTQGELHFQSLSTVESTVPIRGKECALSLGLDINYNPEKKENKLSGTLNGDLTIGNVNFAAGFNLGDPALTLKLDQGSTLNFKEVGEFLLGEDLFNALPEDLTNDLAGIEIDRFSSSIDFENKGFTLDISTTLKNITLGTDDLLIGRANLTLKLDVSANKKYCLIDISGGGNIGSAVIFEECKFTFEYDRWNGHTDWKLGGVFDAEILGHDLKIVAGFQDKDDVKTLALHAVDPFPAIVFPGVGSFELDDFILMVEKKEGQKASWGLSTTFQLDTEADIFDLRSGTVALINETDKSGLKLSADGIDMKIPGLEHLPWFTMDQPQLELVYHKSGKQWSCHGQTGFIAHNVPDILTRIFQFEQVVTECTINDKKAEFSIRLKDGLIQIPAPMDVGDFGHAYIGINEIKIDLLNGGSLTAKLKFGLPKGLNAIFQPDPTAEDKLEIFRVYDPEKSGNKDEDLLGLNLVICAKDGLLCQLDQSPFKFYEFSEDANGRKILDFDLKEFGHFSIDIPVFSLETDGSFKASGGFDIKRELRFPLTPFKFLLEKMKLDDAAGALPDGIPIKGVKFYSEEEGFQCDAFFDLFMLDGDRVPLPGWLREGFDAVDDIMNRLPKEFLKYGNIEIPKHLHFNIDFSADGSLAFNLSVKDPAGEDEAVPLKFLLPSFPSFTGIELYSIAFGEMFGGALLRLDLDVEIDTFDIPSLLAALLIPYDNLPPEIRDRLPDPGNYQNTFRAQNLLVAIVYQSGIPIPIPLFYDKLGIVYKGLNGIELESSFSFPKPQIDVKDFILLFSELKGFFVEENKRIDIEKLEEEITFGNFTIGPNYLRFPKYISTEEDDPKVGKLLGTQEGFTISPAKLIGAVLNAIKFLSINDLIQVVEVNRRVGEIDLNIFDLLNIHYEYAFTTPYEFIDYAYRELSSFTQTQAKEFIKILPPQKTGLPEKIDGEYRYQTIPVTEKTRGLVVFLKGDLNIADALLFDTGFGLVATGEGFGMGMNFDGNFTDIFNIHMKGLVGIKNDGQFLLEGESQLEILHQNILYGYCRFSNEGFTIEAKAGDGPVRVEGLLEGEFTNDIFRLEGKTSLMLFSLSALGEAKFLFTDSEKLIYLHGNIEIGNFIKLEATFKTFADLQQAGMYLSMYGKLSELLELKLEGGALLSETGLQAKGEAWMKVLDQEVVAANFAYLNNVLTFNGFLDLFPGNDLMVIDGDVAGLLSESKFELTGDCRIILVNCKFAGAKVLITDEEFMFHSQLFNLKSLLYLKSSDAGFTLYGTMSPIIFGKILQITCAENVIPISEYDLGGPAIYVSTVPGQAGFALNGRISVLGIETSTEIRFQEDGFLFSVAGKVFNVIKASFTVSGKDFNDSKNILISGTIETGDFEQQAITVITETARDVNEQLQIADSKLVDAKKYLTEQQRKVNNLNNEIRKCKDRIKVLKKQIENKKNWFRGLHWAVKPWKLAELGVYVGARGLEIAGLYATIGVLEGAKLIALGALEIAKAAVDVGRVALIGASVITTALAEASKAVISAGANFLTIHSASFSTQLNSTCGGSTRINLDVTFLGVRYSLENISFNFLQPQVGVKSLVDTLMKR